MKATLHMNDGTSINYEDKVINFEEFIKFVADKKWCILKDKQTVALNVNRIIWINEVKE